MAAGYLPDFGTTYGPCIECTHRDCIATSAMYVAPCAHCDEPIETRGFFDVRTDEQRRNGEINLVHAVCEYEAIEKGE